MEIPDRFSKPMFNNLKNVERDHKGRYILNEDGTLKEKTIPKPAIMPIKKMEVES